MNRCVIISLPILLLTAQVVRAEIISQVNIGAAVAVNGFATTNAPPETKPFSKRFDQEDGRALSASGTVRVSTVADASASASLYWGYNQAGSRAAGFFYWSATAFARAATEERSESGQNYLEIGSAQASASSDATLTVTFNTPQDVQLLVIENDQVVQDTTRLGLLVSRFTIDGDAAYGGFGGEYEDSVSNDGFLKWSTGSAFLGESPSLPIMPQDYPSPVMANEVSDAVNSNFDADWDELAVQPSDVAGINLTAFAAPVEEDGSGHTETMYFDPELAIGYGFITHDSPNPFTSFEVPSALPMGDDLFSIHYDGESYDLMAGETFDFTVIDPLGVNSFLLMGIDESELIDADGNGHPPFVFGATFRDPGVANFSTFAVVAVPEPSSAATLLAASGLVLLRRHRRRPL